MWSSATASSSPVVTPGRTAARTACERPAVTSPEARISSISCGGLDLDHASTPLREQRDARTGSARHRAAPTPQSRARLPGSSSTPRALERAGRDLLDLTDRVDAGEQALAIVEARQRGGLFPVDLQAVPDGLGLVVVALHHLAVDQHAAAGEPTDELLLVDDQLEDPVELLAQVGQRGPQLLGLGDRAREPVEQEAGLGIRLGQPVLDHRHGDLVGDEVAGVHECLGLGPSSVWPLTLARKMSPVRAAGTPSRRR